MRLLALDLGTRTTGVALADTDADVVVALDDITHASIEELTEKLRPIVAAKHVENIVVGLPLLLDGHEGAQASITRDAAQELSRAFSLPVQLLDERYTTRKNRPRSHPGSDHAEAACELANVALVRGKNGVDK